MIIGEATSFDCLIVQTKVEDSGSPVCIALEIYAFNVSIVIIF